MARYKLVFKQSVAKDLRRIPNRDVRRILDRIESLADTPLPHCAVKLSVQERYRLRVGQYRVLYEVRDDAVVVVVVKVGHRRDVYR